MEFYFTIFRHKDNSEVIINDDLDKTVCDELQLEYNHINDLGNIDYGHFYFFECKENPEIFGGQTSISWVGFINSIVFYSQIRTGRVAEYDLRAALGWCMDHSVEFPRSAKVLLSRFIDFIKRNDYYLKVRGHGIDSVYKTGWINQYDKSRIIEDETALFLIDNAGCLKKVYPYPHVCNIEHVRYAYVTQDEITIKKLRIPLEVNAIDRDFADFRMEVKGVRYLEIPEKLVIDEIMRVKGAYNKDFVYDYLRSTWRINIDKINFI